jgi:hypothetical protein
MVFKEFLTLTALQGNRFHKNINMFIEKTEVYDVRKDWWIRRKISYLSSRFITFAVHYHPAVDNKRKEKGKDGRISAIMK